MSKRLLATVLAFALVCGCVLIAGGLSQGGVAKAVPQTITETSACPATGCASGTCHGFDDVPEPDGVHEMICPETSCASVECHAWDTMLGRYHQASNASLNVWILMPVALVIGLVLIMRKVR